MPAGNPFLRTCIITCPKRKESLGATLRSYYLADFVYDPAIFCDVGLHADPRLSQAANSLQAITEMLGLPWDWLLFAEDDVEFNRHIEHNLKSWASLNDHGMSVVKLYSVTPHDGYEGFVPDCRKIGGSQGLVFSRAAAQKIVQNWGNFPVTYMQDLRMFQTLCAVYVHQPNLVQHAVVASTWGGPPHRSTTFDLNWRRNS
jgi:hypothetical protein